MSIDRLQETIDRSIANARGFARELFAENHMNAEQVQAFVNEQGAMTVATLDREGKPHAAIVAAGCADGRLYIGVTPRTALLGNIRRSEEIAFTCGEKVVGQGRARLVGRAGDQRQLAAELPGTLKAAIEQDWNGYLYTIEPSRVFPAM